MLNHPSPLALSLLPALHYWAPFKRSTSLATRSRQVPMHSLPKFRNDVWRVCSFIEKKQHRQASPGTTASIAYTTQGVYSITVQSTSTGPFNLNILLVKQKKKKKENVFLFVTIFVFSRDFQWTSLRTRFR